MKRPSPEQQPPDPAPPAQGGADAPRPGRKVWQSPALVRLGTLEELVLGGGKAGTLVDGDPRASRKRGTG